MAMQKDVLGLTPIILPKAENSAAVNKLDRANDGADDDEIVFSSDDDESLSGAKTSPEASQSPDATGSTLEPSSSYTPAAVNTVEDFNEDDLLALEEIENHYVKTGSSQIAPADEAVDICAAVNEFPSVGCSEDSCGKDGEPTSEAERMNWDDSEIMNSQT
jgi:hypothetical protein